MARSWSFLFFIWVCGLALPAEGGTPKAPRLLSMEPPVDFGRGEPTLPTIFIVGDSTSARLSGTHQGWGVPFADFFNPEVANVLNLSMPGRSSRTYLTEGWWAKVESAIKAGDVVLLQFGHNDRSPVNDPSRARGTLPGTGEESQAIENSLTKQRETVRTYGAYLRTMVDAVRRRGATPVVLSTTVRCMWMNHRVERDVFNYARWAEEVAKSGQAGFVDVKKLLADHYDDLGEAYVRTFFPQDTMHTNPAGAQVTAALIFHELRRRAMLDPVWVRPEFK